ncbi:MAG TPA: DUF4920 domain-containing protein [Bacteroidia bacterium]|nr:DUF4920 domain-containing protein [Bacteroidia bacterium]HNU34187.1 DUF4920 domain-containing protein [Bacteroidia bacterium]
MRKLIALCIVVAASTQLFAQEHFGKKITAEGAITMAELDAQLKDKDKVEAKVTGKVSAICKAMGCWMKMEREGGEAMMVKMKDHKFYLPKDCEGKTATIEGVASVKKRTVEELKHYAEDEGKSQAEIDAIKEPTEEVVFIAAGVILQ